MRLLRYLALETAFAAASLVALGTAVGWASSAMVHHLEDRAAYARLAPFRVHPPGRIEPTPLPDPVIADEPAGTFLGMSDELLLARVAGQPIAKVKLNRGGSSLSFRIEFADGSRAAFKPAQTNLQTIPRKEVAAYRINRLLGLTGVPPAVPRVVSREDIISKLHPDSLPSLGRIQAETIFNIKGRTAGVVSYWIPEIKESGLDTPDGARESFAWLTVGNPIPPEKQKLAGQLSELVVFDFVTANPDRYSGGNMKMSPDGDHLFFMDNTMAFFLNPEGHEKNRVVLEKTQRFSSRLISALDRLTPETLEQVLAPDADSSEILTTSEMRAVVSRREFVQKYVATLSAVHGASNVLVFP